MPTHRPKPFARTGRVSGRKSRALRDRKSSGRWRSGWPSSRSESGTRTHTRASSPAGAAVRAGWRGLSLPRRGPSRRARTSSQSVGGRCRRISNVAAAAAAGAGADFRRANPRLAKVSLRHDHRWRRRGAGIGPTPHPDPPPQGGRENPEGGPRRQGGRENRETDLRPRREKIAPRRIQIGAAAVEVGAEVAASDRAVHRARAARLAPVTAPRQADGLRIALNTPE